MFLQQFLTDYDESLNVHVNIDPLGMLVIWSAFGQKVFNSRVNSISNDVRNYTLNLFNHYMVRRIGEDDTVVLSTKLKEKYTSKDALGFKQACLLYLENMFVYSLLKHEEGEDINDVKIDTLGVLGGLNGRRRWEENDRNPTLTFSTGKEGEILVRQLSLGVSGRYKTPLREIGFFDNNYNYDKGTMLWNKAKSLVQKSQLEDLSDLLYKHFKKLLEQNTEKPEFHFGDLPLEVSQAFAKAFPSSGAVGTYTSSFWLEVSGLNTGAAGALLSVIQTNEKLAKSNNFKGLLYASIEKASSDKDKIDKEEAQKLKDIQTLEPFLASAMLLFTLMASVKSQSIKDVKKSWYESFKRNEETLPKLAEKADELIQKLGGTAKVRFYELLKLAQTKSLTEQIEHLLTYHKKIMDARGQHPWVTLDENNNLKVHIRTTSLDNWQAKGIWYHNYYLPEFQSLVRGFQGETV